MKYKIFMDKIEEAAEIVARSQKIVVFTGAGMSAESGIPDFRRKALGIFIMYL